MRQEAGGVADEELGKGGVVTSRRRLYGTLDVQKLKRLCIVAGEIYQQQTPA